MIYDARQESAKNSYYLSSEAKAAIVPGDVQWIKQNVGDLTEDKQPFLLHRLEIEHW
jgi:hypothetical protein